MIKECDKYGQLSLNCLSDTSKTPASTYPIEIKIIKKIRLCVECGKQHDTGVEDKEKGTFERIDKCIDCLMSKCSFISKTEQKR